MYEGAVPAEGDNDRAKDKRSIKREKTREGVEVGELTTFIWDFFTRHWGLSPAVKP